MAEATGEGIGLEATGIVTKERRATTEILRASDLQLCVWGVIFFPIVLFLIMDTYPVRGKEGTIVP